MSLDPLPPFNRTALLLDLDGTLLDIAPTPDSVVVEDGLVDTLTTLRGRLDDALAIITGRPIETIDTLLDRAPWAIAGEHGGAIRRRPDGVTERPDMPPPPRTWIETAERLRDAHPGAILEVKARGFALHFRQVPSAGTAFEAAMRAMVADTPDFQLLAGHMLWEIRPRGADKGVAVAALLEQAPFAGRLPLFIGDDVTDEDGMKVARAVGGAGLRVDAAFGTPSGVRNWLRAAAALGDWPELPHANG